MPQLGLLADQPWWVPVLYIVVMGHITNLCVTLYLHRSATHEGVVFHPVISHFMRMWLWLTTGINTREWVACHRKHHAFSDREGDPHSPVQEGLLEIVFGGVFFYQEAVADQEVADRARRQRDLGRHIGRIAIQPGLVGLVCCRSLAGFLACRFRHCSSLGGFRQHRPSAPADYVFRQALGNPETALPNMYGLGQGTSKSCRSGSGPSKGTSRVKVKAGFCWKSAGLGKNFSLTVRQSSREFQ